MFSLWAQRLCVSFQRRSPYLTQRQQRRRTISADESASSTLRLAGAMRTHVGCIRQSNEDVVVFVAPAEGAPERRTGYLALVADGMGGHAAGEVASALAAEVIRDTVYSTQTPPCEALRSSFHAANRAILALSAVRPETRGMGTTCTALLVQDGRLWLGHIGDSRAYIMRGGKLHQLSQDQTLHAQLIRDGSMTAKEAATTPGGNLLLQALGAREELSPQIWTHGLQMRLDDILVLCSDGLYAHLDDTEIASIIRASAPEEACRRLIEAALEDGGSDNVSVGVFTVQQSDSARSSGHASTKPIEIEC